MLGFEYPWAAALIPLPLLLYFFVPRATQQQAALRVPFFQQLASNTAAVAHHVQRRLRLGLLCAWWLLLIAAACGPQWIGEESSLPASGRDLMLAVDLSGSMETRDMLIDDRYVERITAVKAVVDEFIKQRSGDRIGLIVFGTQAYVQAPLTFDVDTVGRFLREAQIGFAGDATAIGDAIGLAIKRLRERPGERHVLILLTDGASNAGSVSPDAAAKLAAENHLVVYTVGVGAEEIVEHGLFGKRRMRPPQEIDEDTLKNIAAATGGRYFRARDPAELAGIYHALDSLEPVADNAQTYRPRRSLYFWPLGAALLLSLVVAARTALRGEKLFEPALSSRSIPGPTP